MRPLGAVLARKTSPKTDCPTTPELDVFMPTTDDKIEALLGGLTALEKQAQPLLYTPDWTSRVRVEAAFQDLREELTEFVRCQYGYGVRKSSKRRGG